MCGDDSMEEDVDEGIETNMGDDVIPGYYMYLLDLGDDFSEVWIRADYIRIRLPRGPLQDKPGSVIQSASCRHYRTTRRWCVTGRLLELLLTVQTGKSIWVYYALRRRLAEKKPVIFYNQQKCFLFVDEGVYKQPSTSNRGTSRPPCGLRST